MAFYDNIMTSTSDTCMSRVATMYSKLMVFVAVNGLLGVEYSSSLDCLLILSLPRTHIFSRLGIKLGIVRLGFLY